MAGSEIENVCNFLASKQITLSSNNEWLKACVEWFLSENVNCNVQEIQQFAYNQLLLADLNVVAEACLPSVLNDAHTIKLQGKYFLQVNSFFDVGQSAYKQHQKILKREIIEDDDEEKEEKKYWKKETNRMLKMEMTDGLLNVYGMEYSPIMKLNPNTMVPGVKVLLKGPVECRSGVIMIQENNLDILGGEVDSLYEVNHMNRLIARKLNMNDDFVPLHDNGPQVTNPLHIEQNPPLPIVGQSLSNFNDMNMAPSRNSNYHGNDRIALPSRNSNNGENDRIALPSRNSNNSENDMNVLPPRNYNYDENCTQQPTHGNENYFEDSDIFLNVPVDHLIENEPDNCEPTGNKVIEVNASVAAFKSKLLIKNENWCLTVKLDTNEGPLKASFDSDLLDRLIGFCPVELSSKGSEFSVNPAIKEKMDSMLKKSQQTIKNLNCCMTLAQNESDELPVIIAISDENAFCNSF